MPSPSRLTSAMTLPDPCESVALLVLYCFQDGGQPHHFVAASGHWGLAARIVQRQAPEFRFLGKQMYGITL